MEELETLIVQTNDTNDKLDELITVNESSLVQQKEIAESISELNPTLEAILVKIAEDKHEKENKKEVEISKINGVETITLKGEKGDTPEKGKDYFTDEEVKSFLNKITPIKGKDYFDGEQGPEGKQGPQGPKGDPGINGRNGKDGEKGKDGSPDTPEQIVSKLNTLEKVVDWKVLKNVPDLFKKGGYGIGYLREISDVELTNLANNDTIKWDSAKNKWVNGADSGGGGTWGSITGTLSNQTDLQNALNLKYDASNPAGYITSSALSGYTPTSRTITINGTTQDLSSNRSWTIAVPTKTSDLTNDSGFLTASSLTGYLRNNIGIAGGTTLIGGTASGNNLTLSSTSNATKGKILFGNSGYDEVNNRLGIGTTTPTQPIDVIMNTSSGSDYPSVLIKNINTSGDSFSAIDLQASNGNVWSQLLASGSNTVFGAPGVGFRVITANPFFIQTSNVTRMTVSVGGNVGIGTLTPTARLHLPAGTATAGTAPLKFTSGTNLTTAEAGVMEYNNTPHFTNSDATRRHIVLAPNTTKVTASAPYTNDGYIIINIGGTDFKVMTTA